MKSEFRESSSYFYYSFFSCYLKGTQCLGDIQKAKKTTYTTATRDRGEGSKICAAAEDPRANAVAAAARWAIASVPHAHGAAASDSSAGGAGHVGQLKTYAEPDLHWLGSESDTHHEAPSLFLDCCYQDAVHRHSAAEAVLRSVVGCQLRHLVRGTSIGCAKYVHRAHAATAGSPDRDGVATNRHGAAELVARHAVGGR